MIDLKLGRYRHCKGKEYEVIAVARDCDNPQKKIVIYEALYACEEFPYGQVWTRSLEDFIGFKNVDGKQVKRFTLMEE